MKRPWWRKSKPSSDNLCDTCDHRDVCHGWHWVEQMREEMETALPGGDLPMHGLVLPIVTGCVEYKGQQPEAKVLSLVK